MRISHVHIQSQGTCASEEMHMNLREGMQESGNSRFMDSGRWISHVYDAHVHLCWTIYKTEGCPRDVIADMQHEYHQNAVYM